jgi:branched-chain amino acid transport system substrate-binding protein
MKRPLTLAALLFAALGILPTMAQEPAAPVKIGVLADLSGVYADIGGMGSVEAVKMAIADAGGTALGAPVEVVYADSQNKADLSTSIARQWFDSGVDMITDLPSSGMALAVMQVGREKHRLVLVSSAGSSDVTGKDGWQDLVLPDRRLCVRQVAAGRCHGRRDGGGRKGGRLDSAPVQHQ